MYRKFTRIHLFSLAVMALTFGSALPTEALATNPTEVTEVAQGLMPILPYSGTYYDRARGGTGLFTDVSPEGQMFMAYFGFDENGNQKYWLMQGDFKWASEAERSLTGILGTVDPDTYIDRDGECITSHCAYKKPTIMPAEHQAHLTWYTPRKMTLEIGDKMYHMRAFEVNFPDGGRLNGSRWLVSLGVDVAGSEIRNALAIMDLVPAPFSRASIQIAEDSPEGIVLPPEGAQLYLLQCAGSYYTCAILNGFPLWTIGIADPDSEEHDGVAYRVNPNHQAMIWYDPATHTAGLDTIAIRGGSIFMGQAGMHFDLYFQDLNTLMGHGLELESAGLYDFFQNGHMDNNIYMRRLPENNVRYGEDNPQF